MATDLAKTPLQIMTVEGFAELPDEQLTATITAAKEALGPEVLILGHHYQRDAVIQFADLTGDSLKLARLASQNTDCRHIVFCGVHFMAETADILTPDEVAVVLPDLTAGCSLADMADEDQVDACWEQLGEWIDTAEVTPITYVNSSAALKAFCGRNGGVVCTSSNARQVLEWARSQRPKVLFFPDQHLGRNTAKAMGVPLERMALWDPAQPAGGLDKETAERSEIILWNGYCSVHQMFQPSHVEMFRRKLPDVQIVVHPECDMSVVDLADQVGSTEYIIRAVAEAPAGSTLAIGTELNLVNRLKARHTDKRIYFLSPTVCLCTTMYRIDLPHLAWAMEHLRHEQVVNRIRVPSTVAEEARTALDRMLAIV